MSGLYVYGIVDRSMRVRARGIFGHTLRTVRAAGLLAIVESASRPPKASLQKLRAQSRVVAAIVARGADVLPARFGAFVPSAGDLEKALADRRAELARALADVRGCLQMTVRVRATAEPHRRVTARSGGAYLRARAAQARARRRDPLLRALARAASPYVRATRIEWHERVPLASMHHLVPRAKLDAYESAIAREVERRGAHAVLSGPIAPFAFAEMA